MSRTFLSQSTLSIVVLSACLQTTGCVGRQTGSEIDNNDGLTGGESLPYCDEVGSEPVGAGETPDGALLNEESLAAAIAGEFSMDLAWNVQNSGDAVVAPAAGNSTIDVTIEPILGTTEWVEMERVEPKAKENGGNEGAALTDDQLVCSNFMRMDAKVTVKTANGAFDDTFVGTFGSSDGHIATAQISLDFAELKGSFDVDVSALENGEAKPELNLMVGYGSLSGRVEVGITSQNSAVAMAGNLRVGTFPKNNPCELGGVLIGLDSDVAEGVDAALKAHTAFDFTWQGEESFELDVTPQLTALCFAPGSGGEPGSLLGEMTLDLESPAQEISGTWPLSLTGELDAEGDVERVNVVRNSYMVDSFPSANFEEQTGIQGISSEAEELSFSFGYSIDLVGETLVSGELTILEMSIPDCLRDDFVPEETENEDGGSGTAGCEGIDVVEAKFAQFQERSAQ